MHPTERDERAQGDNHRNDEPPGSMRIEPFQSFDIRHGSGSHISRTAIQEVGRGQSFYRPVKTTSDIRDDAVGHVVSEPHLNPGHHRSPNYQDTQDYQSWQQDGASTASRGQTNQVCSNRSTPNSHPLLQEARTDGKR